MTPDALGHAATSKRPRTERLLYLSVFAAGSILAGAAAVRALVTGEVVSVRIPTTLPGGDWLLAIDALGAVFLLTILTIGLACAIFGTHLHGPDARPPVLGQAAFAVLVGAIALVVASASVVSFLIAWEIMAISSYVLIVTEHTWVDVRRAGLIYLVATHTATLALFAMFAIMAGPAADWSFPALANAAGSLGGGAKAAILLLALFGFGFKAGCVPLHFWLPPAHAAAPSHVSALMSGVVIKTGIYGLLRVLLLVGGAPAWWGWTVLALGLASSVLGVLWALAQHDVKRLLAYHSVENIGIILMGMGVGVLGVSRQSAAIAMLGFSAALLHTVNHALFKSVLFFGAGAVYHATGTRDLERLGGLARRMPWTWLAFLVGAAAIVGLPPFNGFVSEWLLYRAMFESANHAGDSLRLVLVGIPGLALTGGLALACFVKVAGVVFLGTPRTASAADAHESGAGLHLPAIVLAGLCIVLGLAPFAGIDLVEPAARALSAAVPGLDVRTRVAADGALAISGIAALTVVLVALGWMIRRRSAGTVQERHAETWACGYEAVTPRMQYTASSFAAPLLSVFGRLSGVRVERGTRSLMTHSMDLVLDGVALPLWGALHRIAIRARASHHGRLHLYLLYVLAATIGMLAYLSLYRP